VVYLQPCGETRSPRTENSLFHQMKRNLESFRFLTERCISLQIAYIYQAFVFLWISLHLRSCIPLLSAAFRVNQSQCLTKCKFLFLSFEKISKCKCRGKINAACYLPRKGWKLGLIFVQCVEGLLLVEVWDCLEQVQNRATIGPP
jgi:hypothetical protein